MVIGGASPTRWPPIPSSRRYVPGLGSHRYGGEMCHPSRHRTAHCRMATREKSRVQSSVPPLVIYVFLIASCRVEIPHDSTYIYPVEQDPFQPSHLDTILTIRDSFPTACGISPSPSLAGESRVECRVEKAGGDRGFVENVSNSDSTN